MTNGHSLPDVARAGRPVRPARALLCAAVACAALFGPTPAGASPQGFDLAHYARGGEVAAFYAVRGERPLWLVEDRRAADALLGLLRSSRADGLDPARYPIGEIEYALAAADQGSPRARHDADRMLSEALVAYVTDLRALPLPDMHWVDSALKPAAPHPGKLLAEAAAAPSLAAWVDSMGWMNPVYAGLRRALTSPGAAPADQRTLELNLARARALPAGDARYVLVNAAAAQLTMFEGGRAVDSMKVVIGKPNNPTPMLAARIRYTALNPYWNVPTDLAAERVAPNVVRDGLPYLKAKGYEVLSDWSDQARPLDPATIDWKAVAERRLEARIRQRPGPDNAMGTMKFMFPNDQGVYLHDTPQKELLAEASRMFSGGCVRLEDAPRLARWLHGRDLSADSSQPELRVDLPEPVPVYITYLTLVPEAGSLAHFPDVYGRDRQMLAGSGAGAVAVR